MKTELERFREIYEASKARLPLASVGDVQKRWPLSVNLAGVLGNELKRLLVAGDPVAIRGPRLSPIIKALRFEEATGINSDSERRAIECIWHHTGVAGLHPLDKPEWAEGMDVARGLAILGAGRIEMPRQDAAEQAARSMIARGYRIAAISAMFVYEDGELERATAEIQRLLDHTGILGGVTRIVELLKNGNPGDTGMLLVSRKTGFAPRSPTVPYSFLMNLAVRSSVVSSEAANADETFEQAVKLARDLVASLDLETYSIFETAIVSTVDVEHRLRKTAQFGHLVDIAQWPIAETEFLLERFFLVSPVDEATMLDKLGWTFSDALNFWRYLAEQMPQDRPWKVSREKLFASGVQKGRLNQLLVGLTHPHGSVNKGYVSPESANFDPALGGMAFLRPFIDLGDNALLVPLPSAFGPALYEALLMAFRLEFNEPAKALMGGGTERIVAGLLGRAQFSALWMNEKYILPNPPEAGEFDIVIETSTDIMFIECKAKAPTRATMAGNSAEALLDYAGAIFDGQIQALRHERILRQRGVIEMASGRRLELNGRNVRRVCITLLDHGALQDFALIAAVSQGLARMAISPVAGFAKAAAIDKFNASLASFRTELDALHAVGISFQQVRLSTRSMTVAQLAIVLKQCPDAQAFVNLLATPVVFGQQNPLLELLEAATLNRSRQKLC